MSPPLKTALALLLALAAILLPSVSAADSCISLAGSTQCSAFSSAHISTDSTLTGLFPFLSYVSDRASFDRYLSSYVNSSFVEQRYVNLLGCTKVNLDNTTDLYARYTTSVLCNAIVQNSLTPCNLTSQQSRPLCADTCADYAISEQEIVATPQICSSNSSEVNSQIRADFTNCALPADSLSGSCISGVENEPDDCGYSSNLEGLCGFCATSSPNATDSCCVNSDVNNRCKNVRLPTTTSLPPLFTTTATASPTAGAHNATSDGSGLSGGKIAGIVIGSVVGAAVLVGLVIFACVYMRRRRDASQTSSVFNLPAPSRSAVAGPAMSYTDGAPSAVPVPPPTGRVARMSALETRSNTEPYTSSDHGAAAYNYESNTSSPQSMVAAGRLPKRRGSLSSSSRLGIAEEAQSPDQRDAGGEPSSPEYDSGQSEQLAFFKDYYSQDEIRPGDLVAVLWAYQPRANDEFELERGEMIKIIGIWDDGWATGLKVADSAEDWDSRRKMQRDSGMSSGTQQRPLNTVGDVKAFPLVCVCLPQHWRRTIDGEDGASAP
ncbi:SH3 domain-containing protein [Phyllosticta citribraziliensis]|uniref:SH3 domain-containing protein n=1 Tax=Phyllosticta citribraziliensis TaxID=989973 RepID=A0ABR1LLK4_9PEZI